MTDLSRRGFFRAGSRKLAEATIDVVDARVRNHAKHWIRPPHARDELDFLATCTRCGDCIDACPHQVIFPLAPRLGASVTNTPALDLLNKGCHLCEGWPCVAACQPGALTITPSNENGDRDTTAPAPQIAIASINQKSCLAYHGPECGACASSCSVSGALTWDAEKPKIDTEICVGCGLCREACIVDPKAIEIGSLYTIIESNTERNRHKKPAQTA